MTIIQKTIKYLAIALAIFIIVNIVSSILIAISAFTFMVGLNKESNVESSLLTQEIQYSNIEDIRNLEIDTKYSKTTIKIGNEFKTETNSNGIICTQNGSTLKINEEKNNWFSSNTQSELVIYIPDNMIFDNVDIETGAGSLNIEKLEAKTLHLEIGAGQVDIANLRVINEAEFEGGAGSVVIANSEIANLDLSVGVGKFEMTSKLLGSNKIEAGVGQLNINAIGSENDYKVYASKGIGSIKISGNEISDNAVYGNGENILNVEGGIGSIDINFVQ